MRYIGKRFIKLIPILLGLTFVVYGLMYLSPGDPAQKKLLAQGVTVSEEVLERTREEMGLNRPFLVQYGSWLGGVLRGDLGTSYKDDRPVAQKLGEAMKNSLLLAGSALFLSVLLSVILGIFTALHRNGIADYIIRFLSFLGNSLPNFLLSVLLMYFFCIRVKAFPVVAKNSLQGLFLPTLALSIPMISRFVRQIRAEVLEELSKPYVYGARARGVKERYILYRNVLHNAMSAIITVVGASIGTLLGGSVVVETVFSWKGVGKLAMDAISARDYPVVQGFVILMGIIFVTVNLLTDLAYHQIDPRIDLDGRQP